MHVCEMKRWHQGWMSPWGTTIAIPVCSTLYILYKWRCKNISIHCTLQNANLAPDYCLLHIHFTVHSVVHWVFTSTSVMGILSAASSHIVQNSSDGTLCLCQCSRGRLWAGWWISSQGPTTIFLTEDRSLNTQCICQSTDGATWYQSRLWCSGIFKDCTSFVICVSEGSHKLSIMCLMNLADKTLKKMWRKMTDRTYLGIY